MMQICRKCNILKSIDCFNRGSNSHGYKYDCRECEKEFRKFRRYEENRKSDPKYKEYTDRKNREYSATVNGRSHYLFIAARKRAKEKDIEFSITLEFVMLFIEIGICQRSGIIFDLSPGEGRKHRNPFAPSIDRIDNFKGYSPGNVQFVCDMYNHGKGQHTDAEFVNFCHVIAERNPKVMK